MKRALRRHHTNRIINKRLQIVKHMWDDSDYCLQLADERHRLSKHNLTCRGGEGCLCSHDSQSDYEKMMRAKYEPDIINRAGQAAPSR
jgi:hypothetical protein